MQLRFLAFILPLPLALATCDRRDHVDSIGDSGKIIERTSPQTLPQPPEVLKAESHNFETGSPNKALHLMSSNAWTLEDQHSFIQFIHDKASQSGEAATDFAAKLAMGQESDSDKMRSIGTFVLAFRTVEERVGFVFAIPAGKYRSKAVSSVLGQLEDTQDLEEFYRLAPLGKDRNTIAATAAARHMEREGATVSVDYIFSLEMPEEKFAAFCNLGEGLFREISLLPLPEQDLLQNRLNMLSESLLPDDQFSYRIRSKAYKEAASKSLDQKK
jgi:hypothetical protein